MSLYNELSEAGLDVDKFFAVCAGCGEEIMKRRGITIMARGRYTNPKTIGHMCERCFAELCDRYELKSI